MAVLWRDDRIEGKTPEAVVEKWWRRGVQLTEA
jgi:hypothetical protein